MDSMDSMDRSLDSDYARMWPQVCPGRREQWRGDSGDQGAVLLGHGSLHTYTSPYSSSDQVCRSSRARVACYSYMLVARPGPVLVPGTRVTRVTLIAGLLTILTSGPCSDLALASLEWNDTPAGMCASGSVWCIGWELLNGKCLCISW